MSSVAENELAAEPSLAQLIDAVRNCQFPSLLLEVPSVRILAWSPLAQMLLEPGGEVIAGRDFEDFTVDSPTGAMALLATGRLDGYEARRVLRGTHEPVKTTVWLRSIKSTGPRQYALALLIPLSGVLGDALKRPNGMPTEVVMGSTDAHLTVDRISMGVDAVLEYSPHEVIGQSLLRLIAADDVPKLLGALAYSSSTGMGSSLPLGVQLFGSPVRERQTLLLPLVPTSTFAFAFLDEKDSLDSLNSGLAMNQALWQFDETIRAAAASRMAREHRWPPGMNRLTVREMEIVTRIMNGDRVPTIASDLFLSQSTVRNHLSSVFEKLNVSSQQELVHLLRKTDETPTE